MRWTDSIKNKLVASMVLLALCVLVLLSNYLDRLHTENVKKSISTMYEDRLVVEEYILKMTRNIYQIREILKDKNDGNEAKSISALTESFKTTYNVFITTKLTKKEKATAEELIIQIQKLEQIGMRDKERALTQTNKTLFLLDQLSEIQLHESGLIMNKVEAQYATIKTLSQFAFAIIIIILIVLQVLVFSGESIIPLFKPKDPRLN